MEYRCHSLSFLMQNKELLLLIKLLNLYLNILQTIKLLVVLTTNEWIAIYTYILHLIFYSKKEWCLIFSSLMIAKQFPSTRCFHSNYKQTGNPIDLLRKAHLVKIIYPSLCSPFLRCTNKNRIFLRNL